jgi:twitching motility protein PilT
MERDEKNSSLRIPELEALALELNREGPGGRTTEVADESGAVAGGASRPLSGAERSEVAEGEPLEKILSELVRREGTDLILHPGSPPVFRIHGQLLAVDAPPIAEEALVNMLSPHLGGRSRRNLEEAGSADFSLRLPSRGSSRGDWRFRVNVHRQRGRLAAALRSLPQRIPTLADLNLPPSLAELVRPSRGLVLISGPTGSGKSSTLAALVGEINRSRTAHVVTIEDPIEYEHRSQKSIVEQIEVGSDTPSFAAALKASLRQDPDVILVGEMRDLETVSTALTAAETGHLILSTLHTNDVVQAIHRIVDVFPPAQQGQVRQQLALSLHAVVCQQLLPRASGTGRIPAVEVLIATWAVRHLVRKEKLQGIYTEITLGKKLGMVSLEESLAKLVRSGEISADEARVRSTRPDELESLLR